jgi:hypothetical protein
LSRFGSIDSVPVIEQDTTPGRTNGPSRRPSPFNHQVLVHVGRSGKTDYGYGTFRNPLEGNSQPYIGVGIVEIFVVANVNLFNDQTEPEYPMLGYASLSLPIRA